MPTKAKKDSEGYYVLVGFGSAIITIIIHYFLLSKLELYSTVHVVIGLVLFFIISAILSTLLQRVW